MCLKYISCVRVGCMGCQGACSIVCKFQLNVANCAPLSPGIEDIVVAAGGQCRRVETGRQMLKKRGMINFDLDALEKATQGGGSDASIAEFVKMTSRSPPRLPSALFCRLSVAPFCWPLVTFETGSESQALGRPSGSKKEEDFEKLPPLLLATFDATDCGQGPVRAFPLTLSATAHRAV